MFQLMKFFCEGLIYVFVKTTQFDLHKCITLKGTLNVKFGIYMHQMTIFRESIT
jgi:hypothetical protein